jgi:hypothetical protein
MVSFMLTTSTFVRIQKLEDPLLFPNLLANLEIANCGL